MAQIDATDPLSKDGMTAHLSQSSQSRQVADTCVICLEPISERAITVPCNHYSFDFLCLVHWLQQQSKCPLCKSSVTSVEYDWHSATEYNIFRVRSTSEPPEKTSLSHGNPSRGLRQQRSTRNICRPVIDSALLRRRHVYRHQLYSLHVGSNTLSGFRTVTPKLVTNSLILQSKARKWIRRELRVFDYLPSALGRGETSESKLKNFNAEYLLEYIVAILKNIDLRDSTGKAQELLREFLGLKNSQLFLHELGSWMSSPCTELHEWDDVVQYNEPLPDSRDYALPERLRG